MTTHVELEGLEKEYINDPNVITYGPLNNPNVVERKVLETKKDKTNGNEANKNIGKKGKNDNGSAKSEKHEEQPLIGKTTTHVMTEERDIYNTGIGDKLTVSKYTGQVAGEEGSLATLDVTHSNGQVDGASINLLGVATIGVNKDGAIEGGIGAFGSEAHIGVSVFNGSFLSFSGGVSHTNENGQKSGGDVKIGVGGCTVGAIIFVVATGGLGALAL